MKIALIVPAYNEEKRIGNTILAYAQFFADKKDIDITYIVVLNGCTDNTINVVSDLRSSVPTLTILDIPEAGKGCAIKAGFAYALAHNSTFDAIGFVDADGATAPAAYYDLIINLGTADGIIASRYMPGARIEPERPLVKRWGSKLVYEPLVWLLLGLSYYDLQCGAKLFKRPVIARIITQLTIAQWAFDIELLYLCKRYGFTIKEVPTVWHDQAGSKLKIMRGGMRMLSALFYIWWHHRILNK